MNTNILVNGTVVPIANKSEGRGRNTHISVCFPDEYFLDLGKGYYQVKNIDETYHKHHSEQVKLSINNNLVEVPNLLYKNRK